MGHTRQVFFCLFFVASMLAPLVWARPSPPTQATSGAAQAPDLSLQRELIAESNKARAAGDYDAARAMAREVVTDLLARPAAEQDAAWLALLDSAGLAADDAQDSRTAHAAFKRVLEVHSRTLPADHPDLQRARQNLANTIAELGDLAGARALEEKVLEVNSRTLPADHPDLQVARGNLAGTLYTLGDLAGARALYEQVLEVRSRTLPADHPGLQGARENLANTIAELGDLAGARALEEKVLEVRSRTLPADHPDLQGARQNLAVIIAELGDLAGARALQEKVLEVRSRTLPDDHPDLQMARAGLAITMKALGDPAGARALQEKVLEVQSRTLPADHPDLQAARQNLANTLNLQGDLAGARALREQVLEVNSRTLPADHPDLQKARQNLANTIASELARSARSPGGEGERIRERELGRERCAELIGAMCRAQAHAARVAILGSPAREAEERCANLAEKLDLSLSFAQGRGVFEPLSELESRAFVFAETTRGAALASAELTRRAAHSPKYAELRDALRAASDRLAGLAQKGTTSAEFDRARVKRESVERELVALARELSGGKESGVEFDLESLAARLAEREAAVGFRRFTSARVTVVDELDSTGQPAVRETSVESLCAFVVRSSKPGAPGAANAGAKSDSAPGLPLTLVDLGPIAPIEEAARAWRGGLGVAEESRGMAARARAESASSVRASGAVLREKTFDPLLPALTGAERIIVVLDDVLHLVPLDALPLDEKTLVGDRWRIETRTTLTELLISHDPFEGPGELVAFGDVEYGASDVADSGRTPSTSNAATALAAADASQKAADDGRRASAGGVRAADADKRTADSQPRTTDVVRGAAGVQPRAGGDESQGADVERQAPQPASILRGGAWAQGFSALPGTGVEVRGIGRCFANQFGDVAAMELCERATATRERLLVLAPRARYLHIATHGWFAPESIKSWSDPEPIDKQSGLGMRMSGAEQVKGMSPMLLCGLALAGANLPEDAVGRAPGLVTADELSTLDLSNCELVVLSACDTNVGERRAGQGVASLQRALQMAGARSVITSLWKVPDEATKELMLDFYRRLWVEQKPKHQALWEAKTKLREAKDERGEPKYTTRDWAAWVLTGSPD